MNERASIFDDDLDLSGFGPKEGESRPAPEAVRVVTEARGFHSREPGPKRQRRTYRTGRNVQFNVKASQEVVDAFYAISEQNGWVLGETMEHALEALKEKLR